MAVLDPIFSAAADIPLLSIAGLTHDVHSTLGRLPLTLAKDLHGQPIADPRFVADQRWRGSIDFEFLAQPPDDDAQVIDLAFMRRAPDGPQQMRVADHPVGPAREFGEYGIFLGRQMHLGAGSGNAPMVEVDDAVSLKRTRLSTMQMWL